MQRHAALNRIYRLVWSHVHQTWVIVSERTRGQGKRASRRLLAGMLMAAAHAAQAGPAGGQITGGSGSIGQVGNTTTITQTSQALSANWRSFNTSTQETVNFVQPSANAIAVNRILDANPTQFMGQLNANGQVYLINPNGILFGAGSQINVGALVASTLDTSDAGLGGAALNFSGAGRGSIVNQGDIVTGAGGYVAFIGNTVRNQGTITAPGGTVALGAGSDVTLAFAGNSLVKMQVNQNTLDNLAENGGVIRADGGAVVLTAGARDAVLASMVNNTGIIQARSVREVNGSIVLDAGNLGTASNGGTLDASGSNSGQTGGAVHVLGGQVALAGTSRIDVSGDAGGGTALVGGNFLGAGPQQNAQNVTVAGGSLINADAVNTGNGGNVAVWSDLTTNFDGVISARGGATRGDGGAVETSGKKLHIGSDSSVSTLASHGTYGNWLLDPQDFTIAPSGGDMTGTQITNALQLGNVTIKSSQGGTAGNGDINVIGGDLIGGNSWTTGTTLTLSAYRNINVLDYANIDANAGTGSIVLRADNTATGVGTVNLDANTVNLFGNSTGTVKIYYNPTSYATPTDYAGMQGGGFQTIQNANLSTYMLINLHAGIVDKTYDGTTAATITGFSVTGAVPVGITIQTTGASASFSDKNAGANKTVTVSGVTMTGANASRYFLNGLDSATASINRANLSLSGITANNKTYDGTASATLSGTAVVTPLGGDSVTLAGTGIGSFVNKNAGTSKGVSVSGYTLTGTDAGNYTLILPTGLTATINRANLSVTGVTAASKTYDGSTGAVLAGTASVTALGSDSVSVAGTGVGTFADKSAGINKVVSVSGYSLAGTDAVNYNIVQPTGLVASINRANLVVSGISAADKTYDGTSSATLGGAASVSAIAGDIVALAGTGTGTFVNKNAGTNKSVTVSGYTLSGSDANNYNLVQPAGLAATISKADLALSGLAVSDKVYDGTTAATLSGTASVSAIGSDVVSLGGSGSAAFVNKNAGSNKGVSVSGYTLSGADAGNYNLVAPGNLSATINKADLVVNGVSAVNKTYDGTNAASLGGAAAVSAIGADVVSVSGTGSGTFADKNAGTNKAVSVTGYTLSGTDAANYNVIQPTGLNADIVRADLGVSGVTAAGKVYDGTTAAVLTGTAAVAAFGADVVSVVGTGVGTFANKNAGSNKAVSVTGYTLSGADASNYNLVQPTGLSATIGKADLALSGLSASDKVYDGATQASLAGTASVTAIGSDVVTLGGTGSGAFADKNVGNNKAVLVSGYTLSGADAGNYTLVVPSSLTARITPAALTVSGITAADKSFDGTTAATVDSTQATLAGLIGSDVVTVSASGTFADANVGNAKVVNLSNVFGGADAGNYAIAPQAQAVASITAAPVIPPASPVITPALPSQPTTITAGASPSTRQMQDIVTQIQSSVLPPQAATEPRALELSSTIQVSRRSDDEPGQQAPSAGRAAAQPINTSTGFGTPAPMLNIQNGGIQLPPMATSITE
ncbi:YDG domain-containing protein [Herbaspirillum sp. YR522]|uniref:YDG domain-containing protein n=1 Tax=Herbaspirillum sp. YR522 TaxID=1144342 RepID=UPI00026F7F8A|nr:YDG domain-containing protein [Herbaspirillum sp. YR522]EJN03236.1 filamentous hemagglutinin family N-terminal domain containing protein [Herbaspirillum sp. YR522]